MSDRRWLTTIAVVFCLYACVAASGRCKPKVHVHKAVQKDLKGNICWDFVKIRSCRGFCLTYETPHWQFPYKESHHPVCVHDVRKHKFVKLRHCDPEVEPNTDDYHYVEAASCKCKVVGICDAHLRIEVSLPFSLPIKSPCKESHYIPKSVESHHPVCVHDARKHKFVKLRHCDPEVEPNTEDYHYVETASCKCKICSSDDTSCEWLPPDSTLIDELLSIDKESMEDSYEMD